MKAPHHCDTLRERAYDYRRGELSEVDRAMFEQELEQCPACALYVERLSQMLALAKDSPAHQWLDHDLDDAHTQAMFATILTSLAQPSELELDSPEDDEHLVPLRQQRDASAPLHALMRLAQTASVANQADAMLWLDWPAEGTQARSNALFDAISATIGEQQAIEDELDDEQDLIPLRQQSPTALSMMRLAQTTDAANQADASLWLDSPIDDARADSLFDAISAAIGAQDTQDQEAPAQDNLIQLRFPQLEADAANDDDDHALDVPAPKRWQPALGFAAAAAVLAIGAWWLQQHNAQPAQTLPTQLAQPSEQTPAPPKTDTPVPDAPALDLGQLKLASQDVAAKEAIKVMASEGASWTITQAPKSKQYTLTLAQGTVLVEFVPRGGESLRVLAQGTEVQVVGTVFYVSTAPKANKNARVGVLSGKVRVKRELQSDDARTSVELTSGQELTGADDTTPIPQTQLTEGDKLIDLKAHEQKLAQIASNQPTLEVEPLPQPPRQAPVAPKSERLDELKQKAQMALRARDYANAASYYEQALRLSGQSEAAMMQLELANLYVTHLNQPNRAVRHLKQFVAQNPKDIATPTTRKQLCRLLKSDAQDEPLCAAEVAEP